MLHARVRHHQLLQVLRRHLRRGLRRGPAHAHRGGEDRRQSGQGPVADELRHDRPFEDGRRDEHTGVEHRVKCRDGNYALGRFEIALPSFDWGLSSRL